MSLVPRRAAAFLAALFITAGLSTAAATIPAPAAHASIIAPCNGLQDGPYRWYGRTLTQCKHITGLGYYWVTVKNSCAKTGTAPAKVC